MAANLILKVIWVRGWGKMAPGRAGVIALAGLVKEMLNWSGKVRFGKVL